MENESQFSYREAGRRQLWEKGGQVKRKGERDPRECPASYSASHMGLWCDGHSQNKLPSSEFFFKACCRRNKTPH